MVETHIKLFGIYMSKFYLLAILFFTGCNSDYSKDLGKGYKLVKTNSCCLFITKDTKRLKYINNTIIDNKIMKPMISKIWFNKKIIIGLKIENKCCFLTEYEKENLNGFFLIDKTTRKIIDGLNLESIKKLLKKYNVKFNEINWDKIS